jgi:gas vesicle protein
MSERAPERSSEDNEESVSNKAKETGQTLKELINSIGKKSKAVAEQKSTELKEAAKDDKITAKDAADIQMLGSYIESIINIFEDTMDRIREHPSYDEQHAMLIGFKKILEEEVNVIDARLNMAKRLKHLDPSPNVETLEEKIEQRKRTNALDGDLVNTPLAGGDEARTMAEMVEDDAEKM